jgi:hypothetical protein
MPLPDSELVSILIAVAVTALTFVIIVFVVRTQRRKLARLEPLFEPGSLRVARMGGWIAGSARGYSCRYTIQNRSQYSPGGATLRLGVIAPINWAARKEGLLSRGMIRLGLAQDLKIGDPGLDEQLRFTAHSSSDLMGALGIGAARSALEHVSASERFQHVKVASGRCEVRWSPSNRRADVSPEVVRDRLEATLDLVTALGYPPTMG